MKGLRRYLEFTFYSASSGHPQYYAEEFELGQRAGRPACEVNICAIMRLLTHFGRKKWCDRGWLVDSLSWVQSLSHVRLSATPWTTAPQASLSIWTANSTQTQVHWVSDAIQPSPLSSPSPPALNLCQHQGLFKLVSSSHQVAKVLEATQIKLGMIGLGFRSSKRASWFFPILRLLKAKWGLLGMKLDVILRSGRIPGHWSCHPLLAIQCTELYSSYSNSEQREEWVMVSKGEEVRKDMELQHVNTGRVGGIRVWEMRKCKSQSLSRWVSRYTYGWFMLMYGRNQRNIVKQLFSNLNNFFKRWMNKELALQRLLITSLFTVLSLV